MMNIEFDFKDSTLFAYVDGTLSLEEANRCAESFVEAATKYAATRGLIDCRQLQGSFSTEDRFAHTDYFCQITLNAMDSGELPRLLISVVGKSPTIDPHRFGETIARNRGIEVLATEFMAEAQQWIGLAETH